ncbi:hypothetical protein [Sorangium sp. So ce385]|uniref:hypothetical protein n=1 Tax=Sorangium sp. So ce385 TaxID=3133308 RepID=UPI003F5BF388
MAMNWPGETPPTNTFIGAAVSALAVFITTIICLNGARHKDKKQADHESPKDLTACLHVMYSVLKNVGKIGDSEAERQTLRITVYNVVGDELVQCVHYVGGDGGEPGRKVSLRAGVIGRAAITGRPTKGELVNTDGDKFIEEMTHKWHFKREEAETLSMTRREWLAIPIKGGKRGGASKVIAVVYLDSSKRKFFNKRIETIATAACSGLTSYIEKRNNER